MTLRHSDDCSSVSLIVSAVVDVLVSEEDLLFFFDSYNYNFSSTVKELVGIFITDFEPKGPMLVEIIIYYGGTKPLFKDGATHFTLPNLT